MSLDLQNAIRLLDALQCGACLVDRAGCLVHVNARLGEMLQRSAESLRGVEVRTLYADDPGQIEQFLADFDSPRERQLHVPRPDGSRLTVMVASRLLGTEEDLRDYRVVTIIDVTAMQEAYEHVASLSDTVLEQALDLKHYSRTLEERVRERTADLHKANVDAIYMLAVASEARDADTGAHVRRIQRYTEVMAAAVGEPDAESLGRSAILHDVGKIHVPDRILKKPGALTDEERRQMQSHTVVGESILSDKPFFQEARRIARSHHENWDGSGYPDGLAERDIALAARIVHLVDVYDALRSPRVYKEAWSEERAADVIRHGAGSDFDPDLVRVFEDLNAAGRFDELREEIAAESDGEAGVPDAPEIVVVDRERTAEPR
ncbi:MAG: HD-GYP domain-containing protein [Planctomycetota bacterium]|jgi:putative nucleotidyltransferase with HDIG domain/PAS domain S-box-containing protein